MTQITISKKNRRYKVAIDGHAGFAKRGEDIVCAAVSMLYYALLGTVENDKAVSAIKSRYENGFAEISFAGGINSPGAFEMAREGFLQLVRTYPRFVSLTEE